MTKEESGFNRHAHQVHKRWKLWTTCDLQGMRMTFEDCGVNALERDNFQVGMNLTKMAFQIKMADFLLEGWYRSKRVFCAAAHDKCAHQISFLYAHVGGGALQ